MTKASAMPIKPLTGDLRKMSKLNICIDTGFLLALSNGDREATEYFSKVLLSRDKIIFLPTVVICEFFHELHKRGQKDEDVQKIMDQMDGVATINKVHLCEDLAKKSGKLGVQIKRKLADSIVISTAMNKYCHTILTSDEEHFGFLRYAPHLLDIKIFKS